MFGRQTIRPDLHQVIDGEPPFMDYLRREYPDKGPHLFLYRHARSGNLVIAGWVHRDTRAFVDLEAVGPTPASFTRQTSERMRLLLAPRDEEILTPGRLDRGLRAGAAQEARESDDEAREMQSLRRHIYRKVIAPRGGGGPAWGSVRGGR